jgi:putative transposase
MARPLRIEFPGATYHVTSRGNRGQPIFADDADRELFLATTAKAMERMDASVLAYCLMGNHYHLVVCTRRGNLSALMRQINGVYTQAVNRRHATTGHVFRGRFKAILVDRDAYLLALLRHVELNPVRAQMVTSAGDWEWSSYRAHTGQVAAPAWLDNDSAFGAVLGRDVDHAEAAKADRDLAAQRYAQWVLGAPSESLWDSALRQQIYLGDADFVDRMQALASTSSASSKGKAKGGNFSQVPKAQRVKVLTMAQWLACSDSPAHALWRGHREGGLTMTAMAAAMGKSVAWVSKTIAKFEDARVA